MDHIYLDQLETSNLMVILWKVDYMKVRLLMRFISSEIQLRHGLEIGSINKAYLILKLLLSQFNKGEM